MYCSPAFRTAGWPGGPLSHKYFLHRIIGFKNSFLFTLGILLTCLRVQGYRIVIKAEKIN